MEDLAFSTKESLESESIGLVLAAWDLERRVLQNGKGLTASISGLFRGGVGGPLFSLSIHTTPLTWSWEWIWITPAKFP